MNNTNKYLQNLINYTNSEAIEKCIFSYLNKNTNYKVTKLNIFNYVIKILLTIYYRNLELVINPYLKDSIEFISFKNKFKEKDLIQKCKIALNLEMRISEIGDFTTVNLNNVNIRNNKQELVNQYFIHCLLLVLDFHRSKIEYKNIDRLLINISNLVNIDNNKINNNNLKDIVIGVFK